jgi:hypothetical protein
MRVQVRETTIDKTVRGREREREKNLICRQ